MSLVEATDRHFGWMLGEAGPEVSLTLPPGGVDEPWVMEWLRGNLKAGIRSWLMVSAGEVVGLCSFKRPPDDEREVEIGYAVAPERRNLGYAKRAVGELITLARGLSLRRLSAETATGNAASQRVLEANGFGRIGHGHDPDEGPMVIWSLAL